MNTAAEYFISTGRKGAQYTLRCKRLVHKSYGVERTSDYICNLGRDLERAKDKAFKIAGAPVPLTHTEELNGYAYGSDEERIARERYAEERAAREEETRKLRRQAEEQEEAARKAAAAKSQYVGEVGQRVTVTLTAVQWILLGQTEWGNRYLAIFTDEQGNKFTYKGAGGTLPGTGRTGKYTVTIKSHHTYRDEKQNLFERPKRLDK